MKLIDLFEGDYSSYITASLNGEADERGKKKANYKTVHEPVTTELWDAHLQGKQRIGFKPEKDGLCKWGAIDVDPSSYKDYSEKKYVDIIKRYKLPLVPVKSKSGGLHIFVFFKDWAPVDKVIKKLSEINQEYFLANEVFPCNKAMNMPYFNAERTVEYAFDEQNVPVMMNAFIDISLERMIEPDDFFKLKVSEYEVESEWRDYPPCVQKMIQEKWPGNHRNDFLFNVLVMEMKKTDNSLTAKDLTEIAAERNKECFTTPLDPKEASNVARSVHKNAYQYKCPPKLNAITPICNKDICKLRKLGIGSQVPDIKDEFKNVIFTKDTRKLWYECTFRDVHISFNPEDIVDQKAWRRCLAKHKIYWVTLPRPRKGPDPFELLMRHLIESATENQSFKYEDTLEEEQYQTLKDFFESTIEQDKFDKLKDGYTVLDSKTNIIYFKRITMDKWLDKNSKKAFKNVSEALKLLGCEKHDYYQGEKNIWYIEMPDFVSHEAVKKKPDTKTMTEMDDEYHTKFRTPEAKDTTPKDN